ncbi:formylglycine-generating enzyme required for sulfatase activity [Roseimicrobium gellanilyticum]|uniref:Formylglycine-generating enzyme required for sulfatase activity n=1 Tax=Roseimicrobium gellanilyticum TaxID=748857 RepID=A0A366HJS4_9BACT|nr:SUMF1/EgtB/PvdO family nonheme iron enzyme [Roseimicrobium gellanilyticum]RBP42360.1 formylglycine-generating enzyme required for sulfatase activity [Roseimicrobium gellanilyticum]
MSTLRLSSGIGLLTAALLFTLTPVLYAADPTLALDLGNGVKLDLVLIPSGGFMQGSPTSEPERGADEAQRFVHLSKDYYIGRTAVTRAQWERFATETGYRTEAESGPSGGFGWDGKALTQRKDFTWRNPGFAQDATHPVTIITYPDAEAFCKWLSQKVGRKVTLPTEAQWEYASRAGATTAWHNESDDPASADQVAWHKGNAGFTTHPVTSTKPNGWGLYVGGNVAEWCQDWYAPYENGPLSDPIQTNQNLSDKPRRVLRGGSWNRDGKNTRSAARFRSDARSRNADIGFRIVAATVVTPPPAPASDAPLLPRSQPSRSSTPSTSSPGTQPDFTPSDSHTSDSSSRPATWVDTLLGFVCCLGLPLLLLGGLIFFIMKKVSGNARATSTAGTAGTTARAMADALSRPGTMQGTPKLRIVDDGFWMLLDVVPSTTIDYVFRPRGGMEARGSVNYQPGPEGHFVYTGVRPESVRVVSAGGVPMSDVFTSGSSPSSLHSNDRRDDDHRPPTYPSAY